MASPSPPPHEPAVCCMCGDHGLPRELFRCKSCRVRLQHSYCSDLYPRATAYTRCNWCLREPPPPPVQQDGGAASGRYAAETNKRKVTPTKPSDVEEERLQHRHAGSSSSASARRAPAEAGQYPVKKRGRKADDERAPAEEHAGVKVSCTSTSNAAGESKEERMRAGKAPRPRARVKVRRYKLLTEVISC